MKQTNLLKKTLLLCALIVGSVSSVWAQTIGLTQPVTDSGDTHTIGAAVYTGINEDVVIASSIGSYCGYGEYLSSGNKRTVKVGNPQVTYTADYIFRKTLNSSVFADTEYVGYTMTIASGKKVTLTNLNMEVWSSDASFTWKVSVLNPSGTSIYESAPTTNTSSTYNKANIAVNSPTGLTELTAGTYTIRLMMYQAGGNKYFAVPNFTFDATVEDDNTQTYTITANVADGQSTYGSIDKAGENTVVEGTSISLTATANESYGFINWTDGNGDEVSTEETLTLTNVSADATYTANFKAVVQVKYSGSYRGTLTSRQFVTYNADNGINEFYADRHDMYTIPNYAHQYFYREGYRFNKWAPTGDNTNRLDSGDEYDVNNATITDNKITLNPSFTENTKTLAEALSALTSETTVTWPLGVSSIVFRNWETTDAYSYYTQPTALGGEIFDIPLTITSNGKIANYTRTDALCQTNQNLKFTIPAVKGMVVTISDAYKTFKADGKTATTVAGSSDYTLSNSNKTLEYTYTGEASTIDIVMGDDAEYITAISVTYPAASETVTVATSGWTSLASSLPLDFTNVTKADEGNDDLVAYAVTSITNTSVTLTSVDAALAGEGLILKGTANAEYTISATASAGDITNELEGAVEDTPVEANSVYAVSGGQLKLYTGTTVPAGKAYLPASKVPGEARLSLAFDDEITGITTVESNGKSLFDGDFYDLCGRKVSQPTKGLYIVNGKKVVIK